MGSMVSRAEALVIDLTDAGGARLGVSISQVRPAARDFRLFFQDEYARLARALYELNQLEDADSWAEHSAKLGGSDDVLTQMLWRQAKAKVLARRGEHADAVGRACEQR